jgi:hypothetical protein
MATLHEEIVVIKISKLVRDNEVSSIILNEELLQSLEAVVQELAGTNVLVEVQTA